MALERTSQKMQQQILELFEKGHSKRSIAKSLKICRNTVRKVLTAQKEIKLTAVKTDAVGSEAIDWTHIIAEDAKGVPVKTLWEETTSPLNYRQFWGELRKRRPVVKPVTIKLHHTPGEKAQIDFCDGINLVCPKTGEITKTHLFVTVLPFSSMAFGEFSLNQKLDTFIELQAKAFESFGGVSKYVIPDNLKSGVKKAHRYDPDANPTYCDFANHMGFAVIPARPYTPKDKANVECQIGVIQRGFFNRVRNQVFHNLFELNHELKIYMEELLSAEMKDYGVSRLTRFSHEKEFLQPLPQEKFERRSWQTAKVHPDCHIQLRRQFYSVPHPFVGQRVQVRISERLIEVFDNDLSCIATHVRLEGNRGQYSTNDKHYPEEQVGVARYEVKYAKKEALNIGPLTVEFVDDLLSGTHPLRFLRRIQGILRLYTSKKVGRASMEYAAKQAMGFNRKNYRYFKSCAEHYEANGAKPVIEAPKRDFETLYLKPQNK